MKTPRLFTATEAAAMLHMGYAAFDAWVRRHRVPFVLVGKQRRFSNDTIESIRAARAKRGAK